MNSGAKCVVCGKEIKVWRCRACPGGEVILRHCWDCHNKAVHGGKLKLKKVERK